jgi:hypothetical protein
MHGQKANSGGAATDGSWQTRFSGWAFPVNFLLAVTVLTLTVALASVHGVRVSGATTGDPTGDPVSPLTISGVSLIEGDIAGDAVHVGATQRTLIVSFAASAGWHASTRSCLADVVGVINWQNQATWIGAQAGHVATIAGDPSSMSAYVPGLGSYCEPGRFSSLDGGTTWAPGSLPGTAVSEPAWLAFDPGRPGILLAYYPGALFTSSDSGASWASRKSWVTPLAFDSAGRLVGWTPGKLYESLDDGTSWQGIGSGPADQPTSAGATAGGVMIGTGAGLWWYPTAASPSLIQSGSVFSIATLGDAAVVLGADSSGHPWLGTVGSTQPGISLAALPPDVASLQITGGEVAVNDSGAAVAFAGPSSAIALASFAR